MFAYYLELAARSLRRSPGLTALMVLAIGCGVAASMTMYAVFRSLSADPIPARSAQLFIAQIDAWGPTYAQSGEPPESLTYIDAMALQQQHRAVRQSPIVVLFRSVQRPYASPDDDLIETQGYAVSNEVFSMLGVPFEYGSSWSGADDASGAAVIVIGERFNQRMFGGGNNVGKIVTIAGHDYRIAGILKYWNPQPEFLARFEFTSSIYVPDFFVPLTYAIPHDVVSDTHPFCKSDDGVSHVDFRALLRSDCTWLTYMVELDTAAQVKAYRQYLDAYAGEQRQLGRFHWAPNNRLRDIRAFLAYKHVIPDNVRMSVLVAQGMLVVCLLNTVGLLLAKFLRRSGEIAVRRALGASRLSIFALFLVEAGVVGVAGGLLGLLFTIVGVASVGIVMPSTMDGLVHINPELLALTLLVAVIATLLAGVYPTYRASQIPPAVQLKAD